MKYQIRKNWKKIAALIVAIIIIAVPIIIVRSSHRTISNYDCSSKVNINYSKKLGFMPYFTFNHIIMNATCTNG